MHTKPPSSRMSSVLASSSLLERLTSQATAHDKQQQLHDSVSRSLAHLLNTINMAGLIPTHTCPSVGASTLNYGIAPMAGNYPGEKQWHAIASNLRTAIQQFEPRLIPSSIQVTASLPQQHDAHYNMLSFAIHGHIRTLSQPIPFSMHSRIDLESNRLSVLTSGIAYQEVSR